ncbi:four helix bundle protein [Candidatus Saccharibacteria bacterium]|nr:MAG: four helix bundle protein [Candidatus Saccharibacteria bacterium]
MNHEAGKKSIRSFTDLDTRKEGHKLVILIYTTTKTFPVNEQFGLTSQIRRAAVSVTSNIAEGFSRPSYPDKAHFFSMAHGSLTELQNQLLVSRDVGYITADDFKILAKQSVITHKLLTGLLKTTRQYNKLHDS